MVAKVDCEACSNNFVVSKENLLNGNYSSIGKTIRLTSYVCPRCGYKHHVSVDDGDTLATLNEITRILSQGVKSRKQRQMVKRLNENLNRSRKLLMYEFDGKKATSNTTPEVIDKLKFVVPTNVI